MATTAEAGNDGPLLSYRSKNRGVRDHDAQRSVSAAAKGRRLHAAVRLRTLAS
jgi:hypothetical protein